MGGGGGSRKWGEVEGVGSGGVRGSRKWGS